MSQATIRWLATTDFIGGLAADATERPRGAGIPKWPLVRGAAALALGYFVAANVGFAFRLVGAPQSVMWLPNSLLLAALLVTAPRQWPWLLASAFPAHLLVAWSYDAPLATLSLLYLSNCADAAIAAMVVRLIVRGTWKMDGLASLFVFLAIGATIGPLLVSFVDAGISVWSGWAEDFWAAYRRRLRANTLTNVILVPALVGAIESVRRGNAPDTRRMAEAVVVFAGLLLVCAAVFARPISHGPGWLYLPLPFLLWTAVRFGPAATAGALFVVAFVSSWYAVRSVGAFAGAPAPDNVVALQFFLLSAAVPLLGFAMVVRERELESHWLVESRENVRRNIERVRQLAGRLISAQEEERRRIARELHDGIGQYVAEMAVSLSSMKRSAAARGAGLESEFQRLYQQTTTLFENVREVSHQLHPSVLQHAGLVAATRALCDSFTTRHGIQVDLQVHEIEPLSQDVALTAYRITQEALNNVATHARAGHVRITLARNGLQLMLTVIDDGHGFDRQAPAARHGLGLVSMEERVHLLGGVIDIASGSHGTRVFTSIPIEPLA